MSETKTPKNKMKKIVLSLFAASILCMVACGPSAEEKAANEKKTQDSIAAAQKMVDDSIAAATQAAADKAKAEADAAAAAKAAADSMEAAAKKKAPAKKMDKMAPATPKVGKKKPGAK